MKQIDAGITHKYREFFLLFSVAIIFATIILFTPAKINIVQGKQKFKNDAANSTNAATKTFLSDESPLVTFSNLATITVFENNTTPATPASPYPSNIVVSGLPSSTTNVTVTLNSMNVPRSNNLAILLVAPNGDALTILSEVGGTTAVVSNATVTLSGAGAALLPSTGSYTSGTYLPTDREPFTTTGDIYPAPAPTTFSRAAPTGSATFASVFNGDNPNGTWRLYTYDARGGGGDATIAGWSLNITALAPTAAAVSVGGRVVTNSGKGISNALVKMSDPNGQTVTVITNPFGYYRFADVPAGFSYILSVEAKNRQFNQRSQIISVSDELTNINFTSNN